jgi:hypothetical protein
MTAPTSTCRHCIKAIYLCRSELPERWLTREGGAACWGLLRGLVQFHPDDAARARHEPIETPETAPTSTCRHCIVAIRQCDCRPDEHPGPWIDRFRGTHVCYPDMPRPRSNSAWPHEPIETPETVQ